MPTVLEYNIDSATAQAFFTYAQVHTRSMTEPMRRIANLVHEFVELQFDSEGDIMSGGWADLSPSYEKRKDAAGYGGMPILQRTRQLMEDATREPLTGLRLMHVLEGGLRYGDGWLVYDPISWHDGKHPVELVKVMQEGRPETGNSTFMPPRPIWETTDAFESGAHHIMAEWLDELKGGPGPGRNPGFDFAPVIAV